VTFAVISTNCFLRQQLVEWLKVRFMSAITAEFADLTAAIRPPPPPAGRPARLRPL
jgi:hypothetical protein